MIEPTFGDAATLPPPAPPPAPAARATIAIEIRFTGSGSEYFRIWIVNLLLTLVTLTLYLPWAKVRRLRYFYSNTLVGGHPLGFHANPRKILRGYVLVGLMLLLYSFAGRVSPVAGLVAFALMVALWPALLKSSMQFRLANTSWRGLRFRFVGDLGGAYRALLPWFVPGGIILAAVAFVPDPDHPPAWYEALVGIDVLVLLVLFPLLWWKLKKYQHEHFAYGPLQTTLKSGPGPFYGVFLRTFGVALLAFAVLGAIVALAAGAFAGTMGRRGMQFAVLITIAGFVLAGIAAQLVPGPYLTSRLQNLLWARTGNRSMHFNSALRFWPLLRLTLKNWLLMVLTLGLYWPFAKIATTRLKLEAMSITSRVAPETLVANARSREGDAAGDAAGDLFGIDIGF